MLLKKQQLSFMNIWNPKIYYARYLEQNREFKMSINVLFIDPFDGAG